MAAATGTQDMRDERTLLTLICGLALVACAAARPIPYVDEVWRAGWTSAAELSDIPAGEQP